MPSQDGRGRTLFEILTGRNKRDMTPQETRIDNPLDARIGTIVIFQHEPELASVSFLVEAIWSWQVAVGDRSFPHTDYLLRASVPGRSEPLRYTLRCLPRPDDPADVGSQAQLLQTAMEFGWEFAQENNLLAVLADPQGVFRILQDEQGHPLAEPDQPTYWRVEDVRDPYRCSVTILQDQDADGSVQADETERRDYLLWDYSRLTPLPGTDHQTLEFLNVEEEFEESEDGDMLPCWFTIQIGREVQPSDILVI